MTHLGEWVWKALASWTQQGTPLRQSTKTSRMGLRLMSVSPCLELYASSRNYGSEHPPPEGLHGLAV